MIEPVVAIFKVGKFLCEFTVSDAGTKAEWSPDMPKPGELSPKAIKQYQAGRNLAVARYAQRAGQTVLIVE